MVTPGNAALRARGLDADLPALTNHWRRTYSEATQAVARGERPFVPAAAIYRDGLDAVLAAAGLEAPFSGPDRDALSLVWTALESWPDTVEGLRRLRPHHLLVTLTNGGLPSTIRMAARHDLAFHAILTTGAVGSYKPHPSTYDHAIASLELPAERILMVASHPYDLEAAARRGMRTAFIHRPLEYGPETENQAAPPPGTDLVADDLLDLARGLGAASRPPDAG